MSERQKATKEFVLQLLDTLLEWDEETVVEWIHKTWPHGIGLYK